MVPGAPCEPRKHRVTWEQATRDEIAQGMRWYADAHHVATVIANGDAHLGAGMLAIYSPQQGWISNVLTPLASSVNARESVDRFRDVRLDQPKNGLISMIWREIDTSRRSA
jgi:hypothetical protein